MKRTIFTAILIITFCFVGFSQINKASDKVGAIDSDLLFDEKYGIKVLAEAYKKLDAELKATKEASENFCKRVEGLKKQLENLQNTPVAFRYKLDELEIMSKECARQQEFVSSLPRERRAGLLLTFKIREALFQFKKVNGFVIILDTSTLNERSIFIGENEIPTYVTSKFVEFYNKNFAKNDSQ